MRQLRRGLLFAVADGVSTLEQGRWAAQTTCERLEQFFEDGIEPTLHSLVQLIGEIDWELRGQGKGRAACTLCALWLHDNMAHVLHVGDSPVYMLRGNRMKRLTKTPHGHGRRLTAFMGMGPDVSEVLEVHSVPFQARDVYFLMTDGVNGVVTPRRIGRHWMRARRSPERCADAVMREIDHKRGEDDATLVVVELLLEDDLPEERTEEIDLNQFEDAEHDTENFDQFEE